MGRNDSTRVVKNNPEQRPTEQQTSHIRRQLTQFTFMDKTKRQRAGPVPSSQVGGVTSFSSLFIVRRIKQTHAIILEHTHTQSRSRRGHLQWNNSMPWLTHPPHLIFHGISHGGEGVVLCLRDRVGVVATQWDKICGVAKALVCVLHLVCIYHILTRESSVEIWVS